MTVDKEPYFKPMLSGTVEDVHTLKYPLLASPKLDGIRATVQNGVVLSRNQKPIRNAHVQKLFGQPRYEGLDGELIVGEPTAPEGFLATSSGIMSAEGEPDVTFHVFDVFGEAQAAGFDVRLSYLNEEFYQSPHPVKVVEHRIMRDARDLLSYESDLLDRGYEGVMLRSPGGFYKQGRSTLKEGWLLKLKVFEYDDAQVLACVESLTNTNEDVRDALGHAKRSTKKDGMVPAGTLGGFKVLGLTGPFKGKTFHVGAGKLTAGQRQQMWDAWLVSDKSGPILPVISYKYFPRGSKDLPRFPLYHGPATKTSGV